MIQGLPTRIIAEKLGLSVNTVKEHRGLILRRMEVDSTTALIHKINASRSGLNSAELKAALAIPPEVLVVENDNLYRDLVVSGLKMAGFGCRGVARSEDMWTAISDQRVNVVVLDLNLGEEDGLIIARKLRETEPSVGIVMMTTRGMVEQRIEGMLMGADVYMVKPVDIRELVGVIRNIYRRFIEFQVLAS